MAAFGPFMANGSAPELVAELLHSAATDDSDRLRYAAGEDVKQMLAQRHSASDDDFSRAAGRSSVSEDLGGVDRDLSHMTIFRAVRKAVLSRAPNRRSMATRRWDPDGYRVEISDLSRCSSTSTTSSATHPTAL
jgi:hypothetical protein